MPAKLKIIGTVLLACYNKDGSVAWKRAFPNGVTNAGFNYLGAAGFSSGSQITAWYFGLIDNTSFSALDATDIMSSHSGWIEFTGYSGTRPLWSNTTAGQQTSSNGSSSFSITSNGILAGIFIASSNTIGGTSGTLWSTAQLPLVSNVSIGQTLTGQYTVQYSGG